MKIIFLDIDGVLNSKKFLDNNKDGIIDIEAVKILKRIIEKTKAEVIMSSGWRLWFDEKMMPQDGYSQYLYDVLNKYSINVVGKTPDFSTEEIRTRKTFSHVKGKEIIAWLEEHKDIEKYVVIDDLYLKEDIINSHLVKIDGEIGITKEDEVKIIDMIS